jgi:Rhodopirellula transposase DDE domain
LLGATRTTTGLRVRAKLDRRSYPIGIKVTDAQLQGINLIEEDFHGDWNYTIGPRTMES